MEKYLYTDIYTYYSHDKIKKDDIYMNDFIIFAINRIDYDVPSWYNLGVIPYGSLDGGADYQYKDSLIRISDDKNLEYFCKNEIDNNSGIDLFDNQNLYHRMTVVTPYYNESFIQVHLNAIRKFNNINTNEIIQIVTDDFVSN